MNRDTIKQNVSFAAIVLLTIGVARALWKDATDPDAYDHLTKQPDGSYR